MVGIMTDAVVDGRVPDKVFFEHTLLAETLKQIESGISLWLQTSCLLWTYDVIGSQNSTSDLVSNSMASSEKRKFGFHPNYLSLNSLLPSPLSCHNDFIMSQWPYTITGR